METDTTSPPAGDSETIVGATTGLVEETAEWLTTSPDWWLAGAVAGGVFGGLMVLRWMLLIGLSQAGATKPESQFALVHSLVKKTGTLFLLAVGLYAASRTIEMPPNLNLVINRLAIIIIVIQGAIWLFHLIMGLLRRYAESRPEDANNLRNAMALIRTLLLMVISSVALLMILDNLGINVTALVAGLGVGGIAIGLAAQGIFRDIFGSLSIVLDKPFTTGDFIVFGDMMGTVDRIGLQSTRIRSLSGEQIVVSNSDLLSTRIRNYKRMYERRIQFAVGVTYETDHEDLKQIPDIIRESVESQELTRFDRSHFKSFADFALVFETVYFVLDRDYNRYMDIQQAINLDIHKRFQAQGIEFAYPTQTLHVAAMGADPVKTRPSSTDDPSEED